MITNLNITTLLVGPSPVDLSVAIDDRIEGLTANDSTQLLYSTYNVVTGECIRSATCWAADIDLTCASPWNSQGGNLGAGTAITPRHIVFANHLALNDGTTILFYTMGDVAVSRTVSSSMQVGTTDLRIGLLSSDLPGTITPAKVLPDNWASSIQASRTAALNFNQEERVSVVDLNAITSDDVAVQTPIDAQRLAFHTARVNGDSGNPIFIIVSGAPVLLFCFYSPSGGPSLIGNNRAGVEDAIATLGAFGHSLTDCVLA